MKLRDIALIAMFLCAFIGGIGFTVQAGRLYTRYGKFRKNEGNVGGFFFFIVVECLFAIIEPIMLLLLWWFIGRGKTGLSTLIMRISMYIVIAILFISSVVLIGIASNDNYLEDMIYFTNYPSTDEYLDWFSKFYRGYTREEIMISETNYMYLAYLAGAKFATFFYFQLIHFIFFLYFTIDSLVFDAPEGDLEEKISNIINALVCKGGSSDEKKEEPGSA